jgi:hypothetical protein
MTTAIPKTCDNCGEDFTDAGTAVDCPFCDGGTLVEPTTEEEAPVTTGTELGEAIAESVTPEERERLLAFAEGLHNEALSDSLVPHQVEAADVVEGVTEVATPEEAATGVDPRDL